jgi:hypothetical protein
VPRPFCRMAYFEPQRSVMELSQGKCLNVIGTVGGALGYVMTKDKLKERDKEIFEAHDNKLEAVREARKQWRKSLDTNRAVVIHLSRQVKRRLKLEGSPSRTFPECVEGIPAGPIGRRAERGRKLRAHRLPLKSSLEINPSCFDKHGDWGEASGMSFDEKFFGARSSETGLSVDWNCQICAELIINPPALQFLDTDMGGDRQTRDESNVTEN